MRTLFLALIFMGAACAARGEENARKPKDEADLRRWLENMARHEFSVEEMEAAAGLNGEEIEAALRRFEIERGKRAGQGEKLLVLPYPGGRHPRIGFLDGAVKPQRETKLSVFTPWDPGSYVVADVPEAIWSNLGLTYLAHTHVPTIWGERRLEPLEWERLENGDYRMERTLPNGIRFGTQARAERDAVLMKMWLHNGTDRKLTDLRVQNCVMLKGAEGFTKQTNDNKVLNAPFAAARSRDGKKWVISAWVPNHRTWANAPVPCLHSDPRFPDTKPGETSVLRGWLSFYEGEDIEGELRRISGSGWEKRVDF